MLWSEVRRSGGSNPPDETLHILKLDGSLGDTIIVRDQSDFGGDDLSGDAVGWSFYGSQVYLNRIRSDTIKPIAPGQPGQNKRPQRRLDLLAGQSTGTAGALAAPALEPGRRNRSHA
jgi:hypothetical protein